MNLYTDQKPKKRPISGAAVARIIIWSAVLIILCAVFVLGILAGTFGELFGRISFGGYTYSDPDSYEVGGGSTAQAVRDIDIDWLAGDIEILPAAEGVAEITISEDYAGDDPDDQLRWRVFDGELEIKFRKSSWGTVNGIPEKKLTIRIPQAMLETLGEVDIETVNSEVNFKGYAEELSFDGVDGRLVVAGTVGELNIDGVNAKIDFTGTLTRGNFDGVDITATLRLDGARELDVDGVNTHVTIYLADSITGFGIVHDSVGGNVIINGFESVAERNGYDYYWGDGSLRIDSDGVDAKLEIEKTTNS